MNERLGETPELRASDSVQLLDTTLRDGEQVPGISLTPTQKADIAHMLDRAEIDYIEARSACTGPGEHETIRCVTSLGLDVTVTSLVRGVKNDVDLALDCNVNGVILVVLASDRHVESKAGMAREGVAETTDELVACAKDHGLWAEIIGEDGLRATPEFLESLACTSHDAGADRFCFAGTVGHTSPEHTYEVVSRLSEPGPTSTHTHDDLGLAMAGVHASLAVGVDLAHTTVNGIGEHVGNVALEGVAIALDHCYDVESMKLGEPYAFAQKVAQAAGVSFPPSKVVAGQNAFTHENGIHTDGTLKDDAMYEPYLPETVGRECRLVLEKHAGCAGVKAALDEHGVDATDKEVTAVVERMKELGDRGKRVTDVDLPTFVEDVQGRERARQVELLDLTTASGGDTPTASVRLRVESEGRVVSGIGSGPADTAVKAVREALGPDADVQLGEYHVDVVTGGIGAVVTVEVTMSLGGRSVSVAAPHAGITQASVQAMVDVSDRLLAPSHTPPMPASADD